MFKLLIYMRFLQGITGLILVGLGKITEKGYEINKTFGTVGSSLNGLTMQKTLVLGAKYLKMLFNLQVNCFQI